MSKFGARMGRFCERLFGPLVLYPLPGSKIRLFDMQTGEPIAGYVDENRTIKHQIPIMSNMDGKFPPIYVDPQFKYRVEYSDCSDRVIYSAREDDREPLIIRNSQ